jgi:phosphotriesterase-related protein
LEVRGKLFAIRTLSSDQILEIYLKEITDGIGDTGIRPGVIKAATGNGVITEYEERCLTAAGKAAAMTGLPIVTHTENGSMGLEQLKIFKSAGANPGKCLIGHSCFNHNLQYHVSIMKEGGMVGFDRFGLERLADDRLRLATLAGLLHLGYSNQLIVSCDSVAIYQGRAPLDGPDVRNWKPSYIFYGVIPTLKEWGVKSSDIENMLRHNPRRLFALTHTQEESTAKAASA